MSLSSCWKYFRRGLRWYLEPKVACNSALHMIGELGRGSFSVAQQRPKVSSINAFNRAHFFAQELLFQCFYNLVILHINQRALAYIYCAGNNTVFIMRSMVKLLSRGTILTT
jgi:hypothetical protein